MDRHGEGSGTEDAPELEEQAEQDVTRFKEEREQMKEEFGISASELEGRRNRG